MKRLQKLLLGALAAALLAAGAQAQDVAPEHLTVGVKEAPPFVMRSDDGNWVGIAIELWEAVATSLGYTYEFQELRIPEMRASVINREVDVVVGALSITPERETFVDFTHTYYISSLGIAVPAGNDSLLGTLSHLFSGAFLKIVAVLALVLVCIGTLMWWLEYKVNPEQFDPDRTRGIGSGLWWAAVTMTTVGYGDKAPMSLAGRTMALVWMFSSLILVSVFTGAVASVMTVSGLNAKVTGPEDLPRVRVASVARTASGLWLDDKHIGYLSYPSVEDAMIALREGKADAVVYDRPILSYLAQEHGSDVMVLPRKFALHHYGFVLPEGSPLREPINRAILVYTLESEWHDTLYRYTGTAL